VKHEGSDASARMKRLPERFYECGVFAPETIVQEGKTWL